MIAQNLNDFIPCDHLEFLFVSKFKKKQSKNYEV